MTFLIFGLLQEVYSRISHKCREPTGRRYRNPQNPDPKYVLGIFNW
ncbi:hypothetical protein [aff. Roholtiella sp. LEGE 12411]|nr:hypothetical protein [aff. Roholtiella sp. LEGE 12411]MBE9038477.1 hypothetical protein [aff. Roholtiella sp. LEGE 12411]